jgi:Arc/MetJ-type ribon-helix-helix transcriptional regulator
MKNYMISVRIPSSFINELKQVSKKDHYLDLSEAVRSIIRDNWNQKKDPLAYQVQALRKEISDSISKKSNEDLLEELKKIRDTLIQNEKK